MKKLFCFLVSLFALNSSFAQWYVDHVYTPTPASGSADYCSGATKNYQVSLRTQSCTSGATTIMAQWWQVLPGGTPVLQYTDNVLLTGAGGVSTFAASPTSVIDGPDVYGLYVVAVNPSVCYTDVTGGTLSYRTYGDPGPSLYASPIAVCGSGTVTLSNSFDYSIPGYTTSWSGPGLSATSAPSPTPTVSGSTGTYTYTFTYGDYLSCASGSNTVSVELVTGSSYYWTGANDNDWHNYHNWACGAVPSSVTPVDVTIPAVYLNAPIINNTSTTVAYAKNLDLNTYLYIDNGNTLVIAPASGAGGNLTAHGSVIDIAAGSAITVSGDLTTTGQIRGDGILSMNGVAGSPQMMYGNVDITNLDINTGSAGVTIGSSDQVIVKNLLSLTGGSLNTNSSSGGKLILNSDQWGNTARVGMIPSGASITGDVTCYRHVSGGHRAYLFWSHPFSSSIHLGQLMDDTYVPAIDVTGAGGSGSTSCFTSTATNNPSAKWYDTYSANSGVTSGSDPGWTAFTSACASASSPNRLEKWEGIRLFFRGHKGDGLGYDLTAHASTLSQWGPLNQGTQSIPLKLGSAANQRYNMIGNPYASPVDVGSVVYRTCSTGNLYSYMFYFWDHSLGSAGQYVAVNSSTGTGPLSYYLPAYTAFQVLSNTNTGTIDFDESDKYSSESHNVFEGKQANSYLVLNAYDANFHLFDILKINFDEDATEKSDRFSDAEKMQNEEFNFFSKSVDGVNLCIDHRPYKNGGTIPLGLNGQLEQEYVLKVGNLPSGSKPVYLHDKLLGRYALLQDGTEYKFNFINRQCAERFELKMVDNSVPEEAVSKGIKMVLSPNPASNEVRADYSLNADYNNRITITNVVGTQVFVKDFTEPLSGTIAIPLDVLPSGVYVVELCSGNEKIIQKLFKQ